MNKMHKIIVFIALVLALCIALNNDTSVFASSSFYDLSEYGIESVHINDEYIVITDKEEHNTDLLTEDAMDYVHGLLDEGINCLYAISPNMNYEISIIPIIKGERVNLNDCSEAELEELKAYLKENFSEEGINVTPQTIKTDRGIFCVMEFNADNKTVLEYYDGSLYYVLRDYSHMGPPARKKTLEGFINGIKVGNQSSYITVSELKSIDDSDETDSGESWYYRTFLFAYYTTLAIGGLVLALCIALLIYDYNGSGEITNRDIGYRGSFKNYYRLKVEDRTNRRLGWYHFCMYFRFPLGVITALSIVVAYERNVPYFETDAVPLLSDVINVILFVSLYIVAATKRRASFFALMMISVLEAVDLAIQTICQSYYGYWGILIFILALAVWIVPNFIYFIHRKNIWLGDSYNNHLERTLKFYDENSDVFVDRTDSVINSGVRQRVREPVNSTNQVYKTNTVNTSNQAYNANSDNSSSQVYSINNENTARPSGTNRPGGLSDDTMDQIRKWKELYDSGIVTESEFAQKKKEILGL